MLDSFSDNHPANYDQKVEEIKALLGRSTQWLVFAFEPGDREGLHHAHGVYGATPGSNIGDFLDFACGSFKNILEDLIEDIHEEGENNGDQET